MIFTFLSLNWMGLNRNFTQMFVQYTKCWIMLKINPYKPNLWIYLYSSTKSLRNPTVVIYQCSSVLQNAKLPKNKNKKNPSTPGVMVFYRCRMLRIFTCKPQNLSSQGV